MTNRSNIVEYLLNYFRKPFLIFFLFIKLHPNLITLIGSALGVVGLFFLISEDYNHYSLLFIFLYLMFDMVDGDVARELGKTSISGAFLDIFFDKIILLGILSIFLFELIENENLKLNEYIITFACFLPVLFQFLLLVIMFLQKKNNKQIVKSFTKKNNKGFSFIKEIYEIFFFPSQIYIIFLINVGIVISHEVKVFYFVSFITSISILRQFYIGFTKLN